MNYQSHIENKVKDKQNEKERIDKEKEIEIINNCKTIKKPKKIVDDFFNRMYDEARIRQIKQMKHKAVYENEEKNLSESINLGPGFSKDYKNEKNNIMEYKNKVDKTPTKYNFQVIFLLNKLARPWFFIYFIYRFNKKIYMELNDFIRMVSILKM